MRIGPLKTSAVQRQPSTSCKHTGLGQWSHKLRDRGHVYSLFLFSSDKQIFLSTGTALFPDSISFCFLFLCTTAVMQNIEEIILGLTPGTHYQEIKPHFLQVLGESGYLSLNLPMACVFHPSLAIFSILLVSYMLLGPQSQYFSHFTPLGQEEKKN